MTRTRIKICGVGRVEDAVAAARAGADAIGMVFQRSAPRFVNIDRAREIISALPPFVTPVGLFVDAPVDEVRGTARLLGLRHIQLHGHEDAKYVGLLKELVVLKAVRVDRATFTNEMNDWRGAIERDRLTNLRGFVLETPAAAPGGTGIANDWEFVRECQTKGVFEKIPPIIAAGGLNAENVAAVVHDLHPWAVDVSSGVELTKGIKSAEKIAAFVAAAQHAGG